MDCNSTIRSHIFWINDSVNDRNYRHSHITCKLLIIASTILHYMYAHRLSITAIFRRILSYSFLATCFDELNTARKLSYIPHYVMHYLIQPFYPKKSYDWRSVSLHVVYLHHTGMSVTLHVTFSYSFLSQDNGPLINVELDVYWSLQKLNVTVLVT